MTGSLLLVLHAHLPWVFSPTPGTREEAWLFECVRDCYLPLLEVLEPLEGAAPRLWLSLSPTLVAQLDHPQLRARTRAFLAAEVAGWSGLDSAAGRFFQERSARQLSQWDALGGDLPAAFGRLAARRVLALGTSAATHGFLPLLAQVPEAVRAQLEVGLASHRLRFSRESDFFWLPECAIAPGLEVQLAAAGVERTCVSTQAFGSAGLDVHLPARFDGGPTVLARDPRVSEQVWSAEIGFPGHPRYLDFSARAQGRRVLAVTDRASTSKAPWDPHAAHAQAQADAQALLDSLEGEGPLVVAPFDAELFGHWWFEGPWFLQALLGAPQVRAALPAHAQRVVELPFSSWGRGGQAEVWLPAAAAHLWPLLTRAAQQLVRQLNGPRSEAALPALTQAARELLLAQASDWPFLLDGKTATGFALARAEEALSACFALLQGIERGAVDAQLLARRSRENSLFPSLAPKAWRSSRAPTNP